MENYVRGATLVERLDPPFAVRPDAPELVAGAGALSTGVATKWQRTTSRATATDASTGFTTAFIQPHINELKVQMEEVFSASQLKAVTVRQTKRGKVKSRHTAICRQLRDRR